MRLRPNIIARSVQLFATVVVGITLASPASADTTQAPWPESWAFVMRDSLVWDAGAVRLADIASQPLPSLAAEVVVTGAPLEGGEQVIDRRHVIRCLIEAGLARGVRLDGALACRIRFGGNATPPRELAARLQSLLGAWLPPAEPGAPPPWLQIEVPSPSLPGSDTSAVSLVDPKPLRPGRNLVKVRVARGGRSALVTATADCHAYGETARAIAAIPPDTPLRPEFFLWEWTDLRTGVPGLVTGRAALASASTARAVAAGQQLRKADLKTTPLVRQGDSVELTLGRGAVAVTVRAISRQDGVLNQIITVRSENTGSLVTARVAGPGRVEWRR